jgi:divalent metal cation (Fe/Co/Zn/Cd) transporter
MGFFNRTIGKRIDSEVMRATAVDCLSDAAATAAVLLSNLATLIVPAHIGVYIDPVMGLLVAILIFVAGLRVLNETKNSILGEAPDEETVIEICRVVEEYPDALGIHDLVVHQYGPGRVLASLHVEVDGKKDIFATHDTIDLIERRLFEECGVECTVHLDPIVTDDAELSEWREKTEAMAKLIDDRIRVHDFRMVPGTTHTNLIFDIAVPFEVTLSDKELKEKLAAGIQIVSPSHFAVITVDRV